MKTFLRGVGQLLVLTSLFSLSGCGTYNSLVTLEQTVNKKWADVQSVYQRRADLIPNLVSTVAGAANFEKSKLDLENARRSSALSSRQSYLGVINGIAQITALEAALVSSQSALDSNKLGYEVGVRINIDVLNAQQQLFSTRRDLAIARYNTITNYLRLKAAAGSLKEEDLDEVNKALQF